MKPLVSDSMIQSIEGTQNTESLDSGFNAAFEDASSQSEDIDNFDSEYSRMCLQYKKNNDNHLFQIL